MTYDITKDMLLIGILFVRFINDSMNCFSAYILFETPDFLGFQVLGSREVFVSHKNIPIYNCNEEVEVEKIKFNKKIKKINEEIHRERENRKKNYENPKKRKNEDKQTKKNQ